MKFYIYLTKRNNKVHISINIRKKLVRQNIYNLSSNEVIYQEVTQCRSIYETISLYYNEIHKFTHLGYRVMADQYEGKLICMSLYKEKQTS